MLLLRRLLTVCVLAVFLGCGGPPPKAEKPAKLDPPPKSPPTSAPASPPPAQVN